jgi:pimeloyl-ACP methyl ester carboxylesterase
LILIWVPTALKVFIGHFFSVIDSKKGGSMEPEHHIFAKAAQISTAAELNIPQSEEFVVNNRGQILHCRSYWPKAGDSPAKAVVVYCHGYSSHINRPAQEYTSTSLNEIGYAYITIDYHGHGYSEGDRSLIESYDNLMDDILSLLFALFSKEK